MAYSDDAKPLTGRPFEWLTAEEQEEATRTSHGVAIALLAAHFAAYFITLYLALAPMPGPGWLGLTLNIFFAVLNGWAIGLLFVIGHDSFHDGFAPSRLANQIIGRMVFIPCAHAAGHWEIWHNKNHHGKTNFRGVDAVWRPMDLEEYRAASPLRRFMERLYRGPAGSFFYYYIEVWAPHLLLPIDKDMRKHWRRLMPDTILTIGGLLLTIAAILAAGKAIFPERSYLTIFLVGWFIPFSYWNYMAGFSSYVQHTHPNVHWYEDPKEWSFYRAAIEGTTHVEMPTPWLVLYQNAMEHTVHHALPNVPSLTQRKAQAKLLAKYGDAVTKVKFSFPAYWAITKACKLYNYKEHYWMDFEGNQTGPKMTIDPAAPVVRATRRQAAAAEAV